MLFKIQRHFWARSRLIQRQQNHFSNGWIVFHRETTPWFIDTFPSGGTVVYFTFSLLTDHAAKTSQCASPDAEMPEFLLPVTKRTTELLSFRVAPVNFTSQRRTLSTGEYRVPHPPTVIQLFANTWSLHVCICFINKNNSPLKWLEEGPVNSKSRGLRFSDVHARMFSSGLRPWIATAGRDLSVHWFNI